MNCGLLLQSVEKLNPPICPYLTVFVPRYVRDIVRLGFRPARMERKLRVGEEDGKLNARRERRRERKRYEKSNENEVGEGGG